MHAASYGKTPETKAAQGTCTGVMSYEILELISKFHHIMCRCNLPAPPAPLIGLGGKAALYFQQWGMRCP